MKLKRVRMLAAYMVLSFYNFHERSEFTSIFTSTLTSETLALNFQFSIFNFQLSLPSTYFMQRSKFCQTKSNQSGSSGLKFSVMR